MPAPATTGAGKLLPFAAKGGGGLGSFLSSAPFFLKAGLPGVSGGHAKSEAFSSSEGVLSSPFVFGGSGGGIDQNGGVFKLAIMAGAILLGVLIWRRS